MCFPHAQMDEEGSRNPSLRRTKVWEDRAQAAPPGGPLARGALVTAVMTKAWGPAGPSRFVHLAGELRLSPEVQSSTGPGSAGPGPRGAPPTRGGTDHG